MMDTACVLRLFLYCKWWHALLFRAFICIVKFVKIRDKFFHKRIIRIFMVTRTYIRAHIHIYHGRIEVKFGPEQSMIICIFWSSTWYTPHFHSPEMPEPPVTLSWFLVHPASKTHWRHDSTSSACPPLPPLPRPINPYLLVVLVDDSPPVTLSARELLVILFLSSVYTHSFKLCLRCRRVYNIDVDVGVFTVRLSLTCQLLRPEHVSGAGTGTENGAERCPKLGWAGA